MKRILSLTIICMIPLFAFAKVKGYPTIYSEYKEDAQREHPDKEPDKIVKKMENSGKWSIMPCWQIPS